MKLKETRLKISPEANTRLIKINKKILNPVNIIPVTF
jgi:hypothetical protein